MHSSHSFQAISRVVQAKRSPNSLNWKSKHYCGAQGWKRRVREGGGVNYHRDNKQDCIKLFMPYECSLISWANEQSHLITAQFFLMRICQVLLAVSCQLMNGELQCVMKIQARKGRENFRYELIRKTVPGWDCQCLHLVLKYLFLDGTEGLRCYKCWIP